MDYLEYFNKHPEAYEKIVASFNRVNTLYDFLVQKKLLTDIQNVFSIGSGDGALELRLADELGLAIGIVEPSPLLYQRFTESIASRGLEQKIIEAANTSFENYTPGKEYDCILSLYSWFAFGSDTTVLEKALECLKPGGKLVICIQAKESPSTIISAASQSDGIQLTSDELSAQFTKSGFTHDYLIFDGPIPRQIYFKDDELNEMGEALVSFLLATDWEAIEPDLRETAQSALLGSIANNNVRFTSGCLVFGKAN